MPYDVRITRGCVVSCPTNKEGVVTHTKLEGRPVARMYYGVGFDGGEWQSKDPTFLSASINEYLVKMAR